MRKLSQYNNNNNNNNNNNLRMKSTNGQYWCFARKKKVPNKDCNCSHVPYESVYHVSTFLPATKNFG